MTEPRKATDVLLELEEKVDVLLELCRSQDLNIKLLSNKLNLLLNKSSSSNTNTKPTITTDVNPQVAISSENNFTVEQSPKGFRRNSRPETYTNQEVKTEVNAESNISVPAEAINVQVPEVEQTMAQNCVPIMQRVVDVNGKSVFLADVEITNMVNDIKPRKTRTNGAGKWMASLPPGTYKVDISKKDPISRDKKEVTQTIVVDGKTSPLSLNMIIFK